MRLISFGGVSGTTRLIGIAALLSLAGSAQAALFSFASDDASSQFTFLGTAGAGTTFTASASGGGTGVPVTLKIDDNNGALPTVSLNVRMIATFTFAYVSSIGTMNNQTHAYSVVGMFGFVDAAGAPLLTVNVTTQNPAGLAIGGTMTQWFSAGGLFGSDNAGGGTVAYTPTAALFTAGTAAGANLNNYGIFNGTSTGPDDFGFSLTFVNANNLPVSIDAQTRLPTAAWRAEGSYSGSATWIPSPGSAAMIGLAGLLAAGRRRR